MRDAFSAFVRSGSRKRSRIGAFTLVEILAAMAILVMVVLGLTRAFNDATDLFRRGTVTVERNSAVQVAMDRIATDLEGLIVNKRLACYQEANQLEDNFDEMFFVSSVPPSGAETPSDPDSSYVFIHYYVRVQTNEFAGVKYRNYQLMREWWYRATLFNNATNPYPHGIDPAGSDRQWWKRAVGVGSQTDVLLDNLVRFDIYVHNEFGQLISRLVGIKSYFDSTQTKPPEYPEADVLPAMIDVYIQVTSEETMRRAGAIIAKGATGDLLNEAKAQMIKDSNVLTLRVFPIYKRHQWLRLPEVWDGRPL